MLRFWLTISVLLLAPSVKADEWVTFAGRGDVTLKALLMRPAGAGPFPAIVALHGCGGLESRGRLTSRHRDWGERLVKAGFVVLFPESFASRGMGPICTQKERDIRPRERAQDAFAAAEWLARRPDIDRTRLGLLGWSNGGTTALSAARSFRKPENGVDFRQIVAFYPGCRGFTDKGGFEARVPVSIFHGLSDDWTPAEPCRALPGVRFTGYAGAYHDFDYPDLALRQRKAALSANGSGVVTVGTHPEARADAIARTMAIFGAM